MAIGGLSHSTVPTYFDENSKKLNGLSNNQILICSDYLGEHKNFIVVDENSIDSLIYDVQTCYTNGWIEDFPQPNTKNRNYYKWTVKGSEVNTFGNYCLYQDVLNDPSKFAVFEDGVPFSDWNLLQRRHVRGSNAYASHMEWNNGWNNAATYEIHYWEDINEVSDFNLGLYRESPIDPRNTCIPLTLSDKDENNYYLSDNTKIDDFHAIATYKDFAGIMPDKVIDKTFSDHVYIKQFDYSEDLTAVPSPCVIEVWTADRNGIGSRQPGNGRDYTDSKRYKGNSIIIGESISNLIGIADPGTYKFRVRFDDGTYSKWIDDIIDTRKYNLWSTDITVSNKNYQGYVYFTKIK